MSEHFFVSRKKIRLGKMLTRSRKAFISAFISLDGGRDLLSLAISLAGQRQQQRQRQQQQQCKAAAKPSKAKQSEAELTEKKQEWTKKSSLCRTPIEADQLEQQLT